MSIKAATGHEVKGYCLHKPGAWQDEPWEGDHVAKVGGKIFVFGIGSPGGIGVKCGAEEFPDEVTVSPYIGRHGWNVLRIGGAIPVEALVEAIDTS